MVLVVIGGGVGCCRNQVTEGDRGQHVEKQQAVNKMKTCRVDTGVSRLCALLCATTNLSSLPIGTR